MKTTLEVHICILFGVASLMVWAVACGAADFCSNQITGTMTFNNVNPAVLSLLNAPSNEGMSNVLVYANSVPAGRSGNSPVQPAATLTRGDYAITVDVDCADDVGIAYQIAPLAILGDGRQYYYFNSKTSPPVAAQIAGPVLNFQECLGVIRLRFVASDGAPVSVNNGTVNVYPVTGSGSGIVHSMPSGSTEQRLYVEGGRTHSVYIKLFRGTDPYTDRQMHFVTSNITVACDAILNVDIVVPSFAALGQIVGTVDMLREFEWSVDGNDVYPYPDYTSVVAIGGPFQNERWDALPGDNLSIPSSGSFNLINVVPSTTDPSSLGYSMYAQMIFRSDRSVQYFRTPGLAWGNNAAVVVTPGATVNLSNIFVIDPGYVRGALLFQGPAETPGQPSLFRGMLHAGDNDYNGDGIPDAAGTYGVYWSTIGYEGVNRRATGASHTAAYGYGYGDFDGAFHAPSNSFRGQYELALGGLQGERSIWRPSFASFTFSSGSATNAERYHHNVYSIFDHGTRELEVVPNQPVTNDIAYCFSEVLVRFDSPSGTFYNPKVICIGSFSGIDFAGNPANYSIDYAQTFGTPLSQAQATNRGQVLMLLPQGRYTLHPSVVPGDSIGGATGLAPIELEVGCGQRIFLEPCLQMNLTIPSCYRSNQLSLAGSVLARCSNSVTQITYELNGEPPQTVCNDCGANPNFNFTLALAAGDNTLTVTAYDDRGHVASVNGVLRPDNVPPVIQCPVDAVVVEATRPCGANPQFPISVTDNCDSSPAIVCTPPAGSFFPRGNTVVACMATDIAGNTAQCSFILTVSGGPVFPPPTIANVFPQVIGIAGGAQMTVRGAGLTIDDELLLGGVPLHYQVLISAQEIQGQAPSLPPGAHALQIRRCGTNVATLTNACQSAGLPRIFTFDPRPAFARGSNFVTIRGTNFLPTTRIRIGFAAPNGTENLLINPTVSADGTTIIGLVPPLPTNEMLGPRDVIAEDARGRDVLPAGICYLPNPFETDPQVVSLRALQAASSIPVNATWRNGFPGALTARVTVGGTTPAERALAFVRGYRDFLRVQTPDTELAVGRVTREGLDHVRLTQNYRGLPVFGSEIVVTLWGADVAALTGNLLPLAALDQRGFNINPQITREQAIELARLDENIQRPVAVLNAVTELMIYDVRLFTEAPLDPHLVWRVTMNFSAHEIMVDAHSGAIVARLPLERNHGFDQEIQDARNAANAQTHACFTASEDVEVADADTFNSDYVNDLDAVLADRFARACWSYFHDVFAWHSYDNGNSQLGIFIHTTINPGNVASWSPSCALMQFANGAVDYEILVHEFTHGVVSRTSGLQYRFQSGALDEHYADTMAVIADRERGEVETGQPVDWTIGENLRMATVTGPVRSFNNPSAAPFFQPSHMTNLCCASVIPSTNNDWAGVHSNSGIPNKAAHLMIEGGSWGGIPVRGMGADKVRHMKFPVLRSLPQNATFADARVGELVAAQYFASTGERGFTNSDVCTVRNAWAAVGVGVDGTDGDCDGEVDNFYDWDRDLVPNKIDNCPYLANNQADSEIPTKDGVGDACDNCPNAFNPGQENSDGDKIGDACDDDIDNDGCKNDVDDNPNSDLARSGTYSFTGACELLGGLLYASEAGFSDFDIEPDCQDDDDDGDGIRDVLDPCPFIPGTNGCSIVRGCPVQRYNWWSTCSGAGCIEFYIRFVDLINPVINPDPPTVFVDNFQIVNQTLYLRPNAGTSVSGLAQRITQVSQPFAAVAKGAGAEPNRVRVEVWARATDTEPAHLVTVVGEYNPADIALEQVNSGAMLALSFETEGLPPTLGAAWHIGASPSTAHQDDDQDGLEDGWEILNGLNPRNPSDALLDSDGDGVSNSAEFQAGTDPSDATSVFRIFRVVRLAGEVRVEFVGTAGRRFQLERSIDLSNLAWTPVGAELHGQGGVVSVSDPNAGHQAFYRLRSAAD